MRYVSPFTKTYFARYLQIKITTRITKESFWSRSLWKQFSHHRPNQFEIGLQILNQQAFNYLWVYFGAIMWESLFPSHVHSELYLDMTWETNPSILKVLRFFFQENYKKASYVPICMQSLKQIRWSTSSNTYLHSTYVKRPLFLVWK